MDQEDPGNGPEQRDCAQDVEDQLPVVVVGDVAREQGREHGGELAAGEDDRGQLPSLRHWLPPGNHGGQGGHHQAAPRPGHHLTRDESGDGHVLGQDRNQTRAEAGHQGDQQQDPLATQCVCQGTSCQHCQNHAVVVTTFNFIIKILFKTLRLPIT